jgi:hypothetical protein
MLDIDTEFDKVLKFSVIKGIFTILGLSAKFKSTVMKRQRAGSEKRINGVTSLPMQQVFDPLVESRIAAESTDWKQLYPLLDGDNSEIENALSAVKTMTFASIENGAFRARHKAVLSQLQEIRDRESGGQWRPTTLKVYVAPLPRKTFQMSSGSASAPVLQKAEPVPIEFPPSERADSPVTVLTDFSPAATTFHPRKVASRAIPLAKVTEITAVCVPPRGTGASRVFAPQKAPEVVKEVPAPRVTADTSKLIGVFGIFSALPPSFIDLKEEEQRLHVLTVRATHIRDLGIERGVGWHFGVSPHIEVVVPRAPQSLLKIKHPLVARPVVKLPVAIHQIG